jgi:16S rRNA processing protein RimM
LPQPPDLRKLPNKLVEMGRIFAPFGIKGWVKVQPHVAGGAASFRNYRTWFLNDTAGWRNAGLEAMEVHGDHVVAKLEGCSDRDAAAMLKGCVLAVPREAFPEAAAGEYYWADLIGLAVRNSAGQDFGTVASMMETGANDVMAVKLGEVERLIPFIASVVKRVDVAGGVIEIDWELDY